VGVDIGTLSIILGCLDVAIFCSIFTSHFSTKALDMARNMGENYKNYGTLEFLDFNHEK
jgi:hypothetical protein